MTKRYVGYTRVSTHLQVTEGTSLESQEQAINRYSEDHGLKLEKIYTDAGYSGKNISNRPAMKSLIEDIKSNRLIGIIYTQLDRLARNLVHCEELYHLAAEHNVDIICINDPIFNQNGDTGDLSRMIRQMMGAVSEFERSRIRERTLQGKLKKWLGKETWIGSIPFGYKGVINKKGKLESGKIEIDKEQAEIVERIFSLYLDEGYSMKQVALLLNSEGIKTPSQFKKQRRAAERWSMATISNILKNSIYCGEQTYNKYKFTTKNGRNQYSGKTKEKKPEIEWVHVEAPEIISKDRWITVQNKIRFHKTKPKKKHKGYENKFLSRNVLRCGICKAKVKSLIIRDKRSNKSYPYYVCYWKGVTQTELETYNRDRCGSFHFRADDVDREVFSKIASAIVFPETFVEAWLRDIDVDELNSKIKRYEYQIKEKTKNIKNVYNDLKKINHSIVRDELLKGIDEEAGEIEEITKKLKIVTDERDSYSNKTDRLQAYKETMGFGKKNRSNRRERLMNIEKSILARLHNLSCGDKKRIIESVVSPERGGKCSLVSLKPDDLICGDEIILKEDNKKKYPGIIMEFTIDFDKIQRMITGIKQNDFFNKVDVYSFF
jgi:site-specific DNA recombinase